MTEKNNRASDVTGTGDEKKEGELHNLIRRLLSTRMGKLVTVLLILVLLIIVILLLLTIAMTVRLCIGTFASFPISQDDSNNYSAVFDSTGPLLGALELLIAIVAAVFAYLEYEKHKAEAREERYQQIIDNANRVEAWIGIANNPDSGPRGTGTEGTGHRHRAIIVNNGMDAPIYGIRFEVWWPDSDEKEPEESRAIREELGIPAHPYDAYMPEDDEYADADARHPSRHRYGPALGGGSWRSLPPGTWVIEPQHDDGGVVDDMPGYLIEKKGKGTRDEMRYYFNWKFPRYLPDVYEEYTPAETDRSHAMLIFFFYDSYGYTWEKRYRAFMRDGETTISWRLLEHQGDRDYGNGKPYTDIVPPRKGDDTPSTSDGREQPDVGEANPDTDEAGSGADGTKSGAEQGKSASDLEKEMRSWDWRTGEKLHLIIYKRKTQPDDDDMEDFRRYCESHLVKVVENQSLREWTNDCQQKAAGRFTEKPKTATRDATGTAGEDAAPSDGGSDANI